MPSPDYFHSLGTGAAGVPNNCFGNGIPAQDGDAYAGIITYATTNPAWCSPYIFREYIMGSLTTTLNPGTMYHISFWVRNGDPNDSWLCQSAPDNYYNNNIGVAFVGSGFLENTLVGGCSFRNILTATPIYPNPNNIIQSPNGWTSISMDYVAAPGITNFIIGNFEDNAGTNVIPNPTDTPRRAYYFIDNVAILAYDCNKCNCKNEASMDHFWVDTDGNSGVDVHVNGGGQLISKFRITLVNYNPRVDKECLKCDVEEQSKFGTITGGPLLYNQLPILAPYNPYISTDFSREATWCFDHPVHFGQETVSLRLKFPPILNLTCCKNDEDFCMRIEFWTNECLACDMLICNRNTPEPGHERQTIKITGMNKKPDKGQIKLIPNPASNNFKVVIPPENTSGVIQIYDLNGSLLNEFKTSSKEVTVDTKSYPAGTYFVRYKNADTSFEEKLIINR